MGNLLTVLQSRTIFRRVRREGLRIPTVDRGNEGKRKALVVDDAEGEASQDRRQGRGSLGIRYLSDGRSGHSETTVQDHPSPDFTTWSTVTRADMTVAVSAKKEIAQDPMGRAAQIRTNSTDCRLRWLLMERE